MPLHMAAACSLADHDSYPRYAYQQAPQQLIERTEQIRAICNRYGVPLAAAALQFSMLDPRITVTIVGNEPTGASRKHGRAGLDRHPGRGLGRNRSARSGRYCRSGRSIASRQTVTRALAPVLRTKHRKVECSMSKGGIVANGETYDLLIKGGEVVDPGSGFSGQLDVAVKDGKIAAVEAGIDAGSAAKVGRRGRQAGHAGPDRPAHPRLLGLDLLGNRARSGGRAHRCHHLARRRQRG